MTSLQDQDQLSFNNLLDASEGVLLVELDQMEIELGQWLAQRGRYFARRIPGRARDSEGPLGIPAGTWHTLVVVWATSARVKAQYSNDFREGFIMAVKSMDPEALLPLVRSWLRGSGRPGGGASLDAA